MADDDAEESLGSGLERQMCRFADMQETFHDMSSGMSRLKKQCDDLKAERQILTSDCAQRSTDRASLQTEIDQLRAERDSLRIEYRGALDKDRWWSQYDQTASVEFDGQGKLKRRIWLLEQRDEKHLKEMTDVQKGHQEDLEVQMATAAGLRDRIGTLELKVRTAKKDITSADVRETELKRELESVKSIHAAEDMKLRSEWQDMRDMLGKARAEVTSLKQQLETLGSEKQAVQEALIRVKGTKTTVAASPRRVLQPRSPNTTHIRLRSPTPVTPTKGNLFSPSRKTEVSPSHKSVTRSSTAPAQSTSLARRYAYIEDRHKALKDEYDKLRNQYQEDLKHWKEYKALEVSRVDLKKKKREARKAARLNTSQSNSGSTSKAPESTVERLVSASEGSLPLSIEQAGLATELGTTRGEEAASDQPDEGYTPDADFEGELENFAEQVQAPDSSHPPDQHSQHRPPAESDTSSRHTKPETSQMASAHAEAYAEDTSRPAITSTPKHPVSETKRHVNSASRITPWLGGQGGPPAERPPHPLKTKNDVDEDDFFDRPGASSTTISTIKAPLIRDRLGDTGPPSSLRRTALRRTVRAVSHARDSLSPTPSSSRSARKRKQVDMDGLSPAEKSMRLKELSKLPAADKRVYYAQYKGKGRYLPPEEVRPRVLDEYEIDPEHNEGANFPFHDVKRRKVERKQMHGGDCECCKDYYEAIGELPRFNAGPAWNDAPQQAGTSNGDFMQEHQNKVSRHRETWRKPPTPPGYWQIAFPTTQDVAVQNAVADQMTAEREAHVRREASHKDGKWRKKQ